MTMRWIWLVPSQIWVLVDRWAVSACVEQITLRISTPLIALPMHYNWSP